MQEDRWTLLTRRLREADTMQAEGAPQEKVFAARLEANERFRLGDFQYEAMKEREAKLAAEAVAPPAVMQSTEPVAIPRPPKPRKPPVDKLADYRGTTAPRWLEPEWT